MADDQGPSDTQGGRETPAKGKKRRKPSEAVTEAPKASLSPIKTPPHPSLGPQYLEYLEKRWADKKTVPSAYTEYRGRTPGPHIPHGKLRPRQLFKDYPSPTSLAQGDTGYDAQHLSEMDLPTTPIV